MRMRKRTILIIIAVVGVLGVLVAGWWSSERTITNAPANGRTVVVFGDSLAAGVGDDGGDGFATDLKQRLDITIINEGSRGATTEDARERISAVLEHEPSVVIVSLGGNDALSDVPISHTRENMARIIERIQERGAIVMLLGVRGGVLSDPYDSMFADLSARYGTAYIPNILSGIIGNPDLMHDRIHPNARGYQKIADRITPRLQELLPGS